MSDIQRSALRRKDSREKRLVVGSAMLDAAAMESEALDVMLTVGNMLPFRVA